MPKPPASKAMIYAGAFCIAVAVAVEVASYPFMAEAHELAYRVPAILEEPVILDAKEECDTALEAKSTETGVIVEALDSLYLAIDETVPANTYIGEVEIPRIDSVRKLYEGTDRPLKSQLGHVEGTAMPGRFGNCVIAGHRAASSGSAPFKYLHRMENGDRIIITCDMGKYVYEVYESFIVGKEEVWVLDSVEGEEYVLTLVTCDPLIYPTSRPNRLIIRARLRLA